MSNPSPSFQITPTGEKLRSLMGLRLKEYDRNLARADAMLVSARKELTEIDKLTEERFGAARDRAAALGNLRNDSMGMGDLANAKQRVDQIENGVAVIRHMKLELQ